MSRYRLRALQEKNYPIVTISKLLDGGYAFVGVSQIREKRIFGGLPIEEKYDRLQCGVWAIDIQTGDRVSFLEFQSGCTELFDIQVLSQFDRPQIIGFQKDKINNIFVFDPEFIDS